MSLVQALALDIGVPASKMEESVDAHYQASLKTTQNPDGRPFPEASNEMMPLARLAQGRNSAQRHLGS